MNQSDTLPEERKSLSAPRLIRKGLIGLATRGSQGLLLALAVQLVPGGEAADLALVLSVAVAANLMTNVGLPTLMVRGWRSRTPAVELQALARAYLWLSVAGGGIASAVLERLTDSWSIAALGGLLCLGQGLFFGCEYWLLGRNIDRYDRFLRGPAAIQAAISLGSVVVLYLSESVGFGLAVMAASYFVGFATQVPGSRWMQVREWVGALPRGSQWAEALTVGSGTVLIAIFYASDAVFLSVKAGDALLSDYRLALMVVAFMAAIIPLNIFVLADASRGIRINSRIVLVLALGASAVCLAGSWVLPHVSPQFEEAGRALLLLSPLAGIRLLAQVAVSTLNARRRSWVVVAGFAGGVLGWLAAGLFLASGARLVPVVILQLTFELGILLVLLIGNHKKPSPRITQ